MVVGILLGVALAALAVLMALLVNIGFISLDERAVERLSRTSGAIPARTAFVNVTVVDVVSGQAVPGQTVLIEGEQIVAVADMARVALPADATVIVGDGRYLMPGLTDGHVHIKDMDELLLFAAHGVTSVRDMWGTTGLQLALGFPDQLDLARRITAGKLLGPTIYAAGPIMEGPPATNPLMSIYTTPTAAREAVAWQAAQGYRYVKVYDRLSVEVYEAIVAEARAQGLPVIGHVPYAVGLDGALASGQHSIEHLTGLVDPETAALLFPPEALPAAAERVARAGVWVCPTLQLYTRIVPEAEAARLGAAPEMRLVPPWLRQLWPFFVAQIREGLRTDQPDYAAAIQQVNLQAMAALRTAGARFIAGTDADNPFLIPGLALLDELKAMVDAGLSPVEVVRAATVQAAEALGVAGEFGVVAAGARADLLLLRDNPLVDIAAVTEQDGVMLRGRWLTRENLSMMLEVLMESYRPTLIDWLLPLALAAAAVVSLVWALAPRGGG